MRARRGAAAVTLLVALASGCSGGTDSLSAEDQVPGLTTSLARVDAALAAHEFARARKDLRDLRTEVVQARDADDLRASDAVRVLDAISRLLATIPEVPAATPSTSAPSESPTSTARPTHKPSKATTTPTASPTSPAPTPSFSATTTAPSPTPSGTGEPTASPAVATPTP